ncbi:hypothetical protein ACQP2E_27365 [Actinoplanes sp. CA-015351]|uniref:hypothetical protein n=1 Tax=Actinoplanes sp. CA-015351 TaxID=3239897 RepID=UPI003D9993BF
MLIDYTTDGLTGFSPDDFPEAHDFTVELTMCGEDQAAKSLDLAYVVSSPATRISWAWWNEPLPAR